MKRIALMVIKLLYIIPYWLPKLFYMQDSDKYTKKEKYDFVRKICLNANKAGKVIIEAHGMENIPEEDGYLITPNHQGMFDVLAIVESNPNPFSVIMKKELKDIFFLKQIFKMVGSIPIDREDVKQSMQVIIQASKEIGKGTNYLIFPEGTRSRNGNKLLSFKGGSFKCASKVKAPIVPVALIDSFKPFDISSIEKTTVQVYYMKPLYYDEYKEMSTNEIAEEVQKRIQELIDSKTKETI